MARVVPPTKCYCKKFASVCLLRSFVDLFGHFFVWALVTPPSSEHFSFFGSSFGSFCDSVFSLVSASPFSFRLAGVRFDPNSDTLFGGRNTHTPFHRFCPKPYKIGVLWNRVKVRITNWRRLACLIARPIRYQRSKRKTHVLKLKFNFWTCPDYRHPQRNSYGSVVWGSENFADIIANRAFLDFVPVHYGVWLWGEGVEIRDSVGIRVKADS